MVICNLLKKEPKTNGMVHGFISHSKTVFGNGFFGCARELLFGIVIHPDSRFFFQRKAPNMCLICSG